MYSVEEQNVSLDKGFYGHPAIGATLFKKVMNDDKENLMKKVTAGEHRIDDFESRVFIFGSIFGGTGAAILPNWIIVNKVDRKKRD
jgi:hypothetical protein